MRKLWGWIVVWCLLMTPAIIAQESPELPEVLVPIAASNISNLKELGFVETTLNYTSPLRLDSSDDMVGITDRNNVALYTVPTLTEPLPTDASPFMLLENNGMSAVAFGPDGKTVVTGTETGEVQLWDLETGEVIRSFEGHSTRIWSIAYSYDGQLIAAGSEDALILMWDVKKGDIRERFEGHNLNVLGLDFNMDGSLLASGGADNTVRLWPIISQEEKDKAARRNEELPLPVILEGHTGDVWQVGFGPLGDVVASADSSGTIYIWDVELQAERTIIKAHFSRISGMSFSPTGQLIASSGDDNTVRVWDVETQKEVATIDFPRNSTGVVNVAFSPSGRMLSAVSVEPTSQGYIIAGLRFWGVVQTSSCEISSGNAVNVRSGPGTEYNVRGSLQSGQRISADGYAAAPDGTVWWRLVTGVWVSASVVSESADCANLPRVTPD